MKVVFSMTWKTRIFSYLVLLTILISCSNIHKGLENDAFEYLQKYKFLEDGVFITVKQGKDSIFRGDYGGHTQYVNSIKKFNRGGKRGNTIMVTGDLPCFAQMRTYPENKLNPAIFKLGDGKIRILYNSNTFWLDSLKDIITVFQPGITSYKIKIPQINDLLFDLTVFHAKSWGIAAKLQISNIGNKTENIGVDWIYGGIRKLSTSYTGYFTQNDRDGKGNTLDFIGNKAIISDTSIIDKVVVTTVPEVKPVLLNNKALFGNELVLNKSENQTFYLIASYNKDSLSLLSHLEIKDLEMLLSENKTYYSDILSKAVISTPNILIDAGFRNALINFDNVFTDSAWLEGVQWWSAYWTNLFQISAAISIDQKERAKNALIFYNTSKYGPAPAIKSNHTAEDGTEDDGLNYYIYSLIQYINQTGDTAFLNEIWPRIMHSEKRIMEQKDPDGDKLLYWKLGSNIFLYQADLLGMPGKSTSPSLMTSGMMEKLSLYATKLGKGKDAEWLKKTSSEIKTALMSNLWNKEEGCFYNHIDLQNISHKYNYYTDHIFSTLYSSLDTFTNWQSLNYLKKTLIENDPNGKPSLMRVGNLQGKLFGNDNIMPTQMAEASRAFYKIGDKEQATLFLESVARAGTIFTEAPGNFPEQMNNLGKGEAFYLFGNPIGSFIYSVVNGLFGLEIIELGHTLQWQPGFPDKWDHANFQVPYVKVSYNLKTKGLHNNAFYIAEHPTNRALRFSVFLPPCKISNVTCNGEKIEYEIVPGLNRIELKLNARPSLSHKLELIYTKVPANEISEASVVEGSLNVRKFSQPIAEVKDPQSILEEINIENNILKYKTREKIGEYEFFIKLLNPEYFIPVKLNIIPAFEVLCDTAFYDISDNTLSINTKVLINKDKNNKYAIEASISDLSRTQQVIDLNKNELINFVFLKFPLPVKSIENIKFQIKNEHGKVFETNKKIIINGRDKSSAQIMSKNRMNASQSMDLSLLFNAHSYLNMYPWGRDEQPFNLLFVKKGESLNTKYGNFMYTPSNYTMLLIELGRSDINSRKTIPTQYSDKVEIPVGAFTSELDLLYFSEVECRNTGTRVGKITLFYANNDTTFVPLVVGKNMDFFRAYTAKDVFPVFLSENLDRIKSYSPYNNYNNCCNKHLNFLPLLCDSKKLLKSIQIEIVAADSQFGLIGINYLTK